MTTHVIASSHATPPGVSPSGSSSNSGSAVIGQHFRVGKKIGEGSFGVVFEGVNLLNGGPVAIKFVSSHFYDVREETHIADGCSLAGCRNLGNRKRRNCETNFG